MKTIFKNSILLLTSGILLIAFIGCKPSSVIEEEVIEIPIEYNDGFELSYWVNIDLTLGDWRGYWEDYNKFPEHPLPQEQHIANACNALKNRYHANKIHVLYHRQFEFEKVKTVLTNWKNYGDQNGLEIVPMVKLQSADGNMNFTNKEILTFAEWSFENISKKELAIYDPIPRQTPGSLQDAMLKVLKEEVAGERLVRVCIQPGEPLNEAFIMGVQDTWGAECQGKTNELWENPVYYRGTYKWGRRLLEDWVMERVNGKTKSVWDLIPVAWDYDIDDPLGYDYPGDDHIKNDPPILGRLELCHKYISECYPESVRDPLFGGYSCDMFIIEANTKGRGESPTFYETLKENIEYQGDFKSSVKEIAEIYKNLAEEAKGLYK